MSAPYESGSYPSGREYVDHVQSRNDHWDKIAGKNVKEEADTAFRLKYSTDELANMKRIAVIAALHRQSWCPDTSMEEVSDKDEGFCDIIYEAENYCFHTGYRGAVISAREVVEIEWPDELERWDSWFEGEKEEC